MAYIEAHGELREHPKTKRLKRLLGCSLVAAIGHLNCLWWWVMDYAPKGDLTHFDAADIADGAEWEGDPEAFVQALIDCGVGGGAGFLEECGGRLVIHDWYQYGGKLVVKRFVDAFRNRNGGRAPTEEEMRAAGMPLPPRETDDVTAVKDEFAPPESPSSDVARTSNGRSTDVAGREEKKRKEQQQPRAEARARTREAPPPPDAAAAEGNASLLSEGEERLDELLGAINELAQAGDLPGLKALLGVHYPPGIAVWGKFWSRLNHKAGQARDNPAGYVREFAQAHVRQFPPGSEAYQAHVRAQGREGPPGPGMDAAVSPPVPPEQSQYAVIEATPQQREAARKRREEADAAALERTRQRVAAGEIPAPPDIEELKRVGLVRQGIGPAKTTLPVTASRDIVPGGVP